MKLKLFEKLQKRRTKFEILRMEVRLNKRIKMKQLFKKLNIKADLTFKKLFKPAISKKVLMHYLDELESKRLSLIDYRVLDDRTLLKDLIANNPDYSAKKIIQLFGFKKALESMNPRELRQILSNYNERTWQRLMADAHQTRLPKHNSPFKIIREQLVKFEPLKMPNKL